jgi:hypothetical protein
MLARVRNIAFILLLPIDPDQPGPSMYTKRSKREKQQISTASWNMATGNTTL